MNAEEYYKKEFPKDYELIKGVRDEKLFSLESMLKFAQLYYWHKENESKKANKVD